MRATAGARPVRTIHVFAMGFTQTLGSNGGQIALWKKARAHSGQDHYILTPMRWRDDPEDVARFLWQLAPARIYAYAYSWGAGVFFVQLAEALHELGLDIDVAVLCDPVWRSRLLPAWLPLNPFSLLGVGKIKVPPNVRAVHRLYQRENRPRGDELRIVDPDRTAFLTDMELRVPHAQMEDQPEYHDLVLGIIERATQCASC